jgi:hypothetical protein
MGHLLSDLQCLRGSILVYRAHQRAVQVLKISLAWGDRFAADAQLKCPLHTPLPLPSYDHSTSECFVYIPENLVLGSLGCWPLPRFISEYFPRTFSGSILLANPSMP